MTLPARSLPFADVPHDAAGHLSLHLYAAIDGLDRHLTALRGAAQEGAGALLQRHRFLADYREAVRARAPAGSGAARGAWWAAAIESWERGCEQHLPLRALARALDLDFGQRLALALAGLPEEDSRFGTVFAELQAPLPHRRPVVETVGRVVASTAAAPGRGDGWALCRPLIAAGVLAVPDAGSARAEQALQLPPCLWDALRGQLHEAPAAGARHRARAACPRLEELIHEAAFLDRLDRVPAALEQGRARTIVLRRAPGADAEAVAAALARRLGHGLLMVEAMPERAAAGPIPVAATGAALAGPLAGQPLGPLCTLLGALPAIELELGPGESVETPALAAYRGPLVVILGREGGLRADRAGPSITLELPFPGAALRERRWRDAFGERPVTDLAAVRDRYQIGAGFIDTVARAAAAQAALDGRTAVRPEDVRIASGQLNRQLLDALAEPVATDAGGDELVGSRTTHDRLAELEGRCRRREQLGACVGPGFGGAPGRGVRALFTGASGTGKTMAARLLAARLGMDLYRVDLAAVVNKYVGETEKNLHRVLTRAEALDVVLLLDEGDALLGRRTEVRSSNDRYANLETNYLLQRLESYQGVVLVTTNLGENVDQAFQRRMDVVVPFFRPRAEERRRIWDVHLPARHAVAAAELDRLARRCVLTGGQIRNAVMQAASFALDSATPVAMHHLEQALACEYQKAGATLPLESVALRSEAADRGLGELVAALRGR